MLKDARWLPAYVRMRHLAVLICTFVIAHGAAAQTMFKCQDGSRVVYSDKPCFEGIEVKRMTASGGRTPEDIAKAQMKAREEERNSARAAKAAASAAAANSKAKAPAAP